MKLAVLSNVVLLLVTLYITHIVYDAKLNFKLESKFDGYILAD